MVLFEIETLLRWEGQPTGIPRVIVELVKQFMHSADVQFITFDGQSSEFSGLDDKQMTLLLSFLGGITTLEDVARHSFDRQGGSLYKRLSRKDVFLGCGAPWGDHNYLSSLMKLKDATGCGVSYLIYDIIPILLPQTFGKGLPEYFTAAIVDLLWICDHVFAISENTRHDVLDFMKENQIKEKEVSTVRLGDTYFVPSESRLPCDILNIPPNPGFVLTVGTFEIRKNHRLLYEVWRRLALTLKEKCPKLLIVGQKGWLTNDLAFQIEADPLVNRLILIQSDFTDTKLEQAYSMALLTVYPSFYEGWGLPIAESLARGKLCLSSNSSSMPEIAGPLIEYFDPYSIDDAFQLLFKYINNRDLIKKKEDEIKLTYRPTSWAQTAIDFLTLLHKNGWM